MKNRRNVIIAFLLCAAILVGVGYAELTDTLRIDGTANVKHENANNVFDGLVMFDTTITHGVNQLDTIEYSTDADIATITVNSLTVAGSTAVFEMKIINKYQTPIYVTPTIDATSSLYDPNLIGLSSNWLSQCHEIEENDGVITYKLTVTCLKTIESDTTTSFAIGFAVTDKKPADYVPFGQTAQANP